MNEFLKEILDSRKILLKRDKERNPLSSIQEQLHKIPLRAFDDALKGNAGIRIIAEIKRASPSRGNLMKNSDPLSLAQSYERGGAVAISVLTEENYFHGSFDDLKSVKTQTHLPVLCKDFLFDAYQIYQSRFYGADAVLLIMAILDGSQYRDLYSLARELRMIPVVEIHNHDELEKAMRINVQIIGVNRRDLKTFEINRERTEVLIDEIPAHILRIAESAIQTKEDILSLHKLGYHACLVGEALTKSDNPEALLRSWISP